ncbi:hypothetical protein [Microvirga antarctica]|uniref:hypothetical protein n=1 Tax=Microvirga antarctica TaxID=2819233 RepID=UPI001B317689|nr:hypothetical protein [Microvirga antarctica]
MFRLALAIVALTLGTSLVGAPPANAQGLVPCAPENGFCRVPYPTRVIYGVPGRDAARDVGERGIPCNNQVFGDPAPGIPKRCAYIARGYGGFEDAPRPHHRPDGPRHGRPTGDDEWSDAERPRPDERWGWRTCARENDFCEFRGRMRVRYGAAGRFAEGVFRDGVPCDNATFGDSAPGIRKFCQVRD